MVLQKAVAQARAILRQAKAMAFQARPEYMGPSIQLTFSECIQLVPIKTSCIGRFMRCKMSRFVITMCDM